LTGAGSVSNALFLRQDGFVIPGGPTYTRSSGSSFDGEQVILTGVSSSAGGQSMVVCLTVNGVNCATSAQTTTAITTSPATYTLGYSYLMDCLQSSGPCPVSAVDVSTVTGTCQVASGVVTWQSGYPFSLKWVNGSKITIAGTIYTVASVQSELQITLTTTPTITSGSAFTANNFGLLAWCTGSCTIGPTTYNYGSAVMPVWQAFPTYSTSPVYTVNGQQGNYTFFGKTLAWLPAAGGAPVIKGDVFNNSGTGPSVLDCGSDVAYQWDPVIPGAMYCNYEFFGGSFHIVRNQITNDIGQSGTAGVVIATCPQAGLCNAYTTMTGDIYSEIVAFNPLCANIPYTPGESQAGITGVGGNYIGAYFDTGQNYYGCLAAWTLGTDIPRTPEGTDGGSFKLIAAMPSWSQACSTWCDIHQAYGASSTTPGWLGWVSSTAEGPASQTFTATLTSSTQLGTSLTACPANPFSIASSTNPFPANGTNCSAITVTGAPVNNSSGQTMNGQVIKIGDIMMPALGTQEFIRVVAGTSPNFTVQRGYLGGGVFTHSGTTLYMECGGLVAAALTNAQPAGLPLWHFTADPLGLNPAYSTIVPAVYATGAHGNVGLSVQSYTVEAGGGNQPSAQLCPNVAAYCSLVWLGDYVTAFLANVQAPSAISISPAFDGLTGNGAPNGVDTHAGPALNNWIMDGRPFNGGYVGDGETSSPTLGTPTTPFIRGTGNCWVLTSATPDLNNRILATVAYVGRTALVDVSGPSSASNFGCTTANSYERCHVLIAGECVAGSAINSEYVNAPFVSYPYCNYPGVAVQGDDTNAICIGDLGAFAGQVTQQGVATNDISGSSARGIGSVCNIWNQQYVFWTSQNTPNGLSSGNYCRWGDGLSSANMIAFIPPFPNPDAVARGTFVPVTVTMNPPPGVTGETVKFWYAEGGGGIGCTSRADNCVASATAINQTTPFQWASETITPLACTSNCLIAIPAISQHSVSYQPVYWHNSTVVYTGPVLRMVAP
jgi:hypothetical protein